MCTCIKNLSCETIQMIFHNIGLIVYFSIVVLFFMRFMDFKDEASFLCWLAFLCYFISNLYPSSYETWQNIDCILGFIDVLHGLIGEQQNQGRCATELAQSGIFFIDHFYQLLDNANTHGVLRKQDKLFKKYRKLWGPILPQG